MTWPRIVSIFAGSIVAVCTVGFVALVCGSVETALVCLSIAALLTVAGVVVLVGRRDGQGRNWQDR